MDSKLKFCGVMLLTVSLFSCSRNEATTPQANDAAATVSSTITAPVVVPGNRPVDPEAIPARPIRTQALAPSAVYFNVSAHADDWELFMNPDVYNQVIDQNNKSVFIYITAGDGGAGNGPVKKQPYYIAREEGAKAAARFIADNGSGESSKAKEQWIKANGNQVLKVTYENTVSYFLRLSDGAPDGLGYGVGSLKLLHEGSIKNFRAVDNSAKYLNWKDLTDTVAGIIKLETKGFSKVSFNLMDPDATINPYDHSDHTQTSLLVQDATKNKTCANFTYFQTYTNNSKPANMTDDDLLNHAAVFGVMESGKGDYGYPGSWEPYHKLWLGRSYSRSVPAVSTAPCF